MKKAKPRLDFLKKRCKEIITDLNKQSIEVYNKDNKGIVVICKVKDRINDNNINVIKQYCKEHELEFTICPREIRVLESAVCIEVKKLEG